MFVGQPKPTRPILSGTKKMTRVNLNPFWPITQPAQPAKLATSTKSVTFLTCQCKREGFVQRIKAEEGEGCNVYGSLEVNKVAGNFHFVKSFHLANMHVPLSDSTHAFQEDSYNVSYHPPHLL